MFKLLMDPIRVVDHERDLELVHAPAAYDVRRGYLCRIGDFENPITSRFSWTEKNRRPSDEERSVLPKAVEWVCAITTGTYQGAQGFDVQGMTRAEVIEAIREALFCLIDIARPGLEDFGNYKVKGVMAYTVDIVGVLKNLSNSGNEACR